MRLKTMGRAWTVLAVTGLVMGSAVGAEEGAKKGVAVGQQVPDFTLKDLDGKEHKLSDYKGKPVVLVFVSNGCPWSVGADPTLSKIAQDYKDKAVVIGIDSDKNNSPDQIKKYAKDKNVSYTILKDEQNRYADTLNAQNTPEVFLVDKDGKLVYHGAVDDRADPPQEGKTNYIRAALDETMAGKPVSTPHKKQWGCGIHRVAKSEKRDGNA